MRGLGGLGFRVPFNPRIFAFSLHYSSCFGLIGSLNLRGVTPQKGTTMESGYFLPAEYKPTYLVTKSGNPTLNPKPKTQNPTRKEVTRYEGPCGRFRVYTGAGGFYKLLHLDDQHRRVFEFRGKEAEITAFPAEPWKQKVLQAQAQDN